MTQPNAIGFYSDSEDTVSLVDSEEWNQEVDQIDSDNEVELLDEKKNPFKEPFGLALYPLNITENDQRSKKAFSTLKDNLRKGREALRTGKFYLLAKPNTAYPESSKNTRIVIGSCVEAKPQTNTSGKRKRESKEPNLKKGK